jgi:hypothetical protein
LSESVVGPENDETTGGLLPVSSKYALQNPFPAQILCVAEPTSLLVVVRHARIVHMAGEVGVDREHVLQPSFHALQFAGGVKFSTGVLHSPAYRNDAPSAFIAHLLPYVVGTGLHGVVMQTIGFAPQTGLYSIVHAIGP